VAAKAKAAGVEVVLFNMPAGNWAAGERGITGLPGREQEFRDSVDKALTYAEQLRVPRLHAMAGIASPGPDSQACRATLIANLKYAARKLAERNIMLLLEAINTRDIPGFIVPTQKDSHAICEAVGEPNLKMQMDLYHMQVMEGDLATSLKRYAQQCGPCSELPAALSGTSPIPERFVTSISSGCSTRSAMRDGLAANIVPQEKQPRDSNGFTLPSIEKVGIAGTHCSMRCQPKFKWRVREEITCSHEAGRKVYSAFPSKRTGDKVEKRIGEAAFR